MRILPILTVLAGVVLATPLPAQQAASPLPPLLAPRWTEEAPALDPAERGIVTGLAVGMTVGALYGVFVARECTGEEGDCNLSREVKSVVFTAIGGAVGAFVGLGTSVLLGSGAESAPPAPIDLGPSADGGLRVGMTLRH